MAGKRSSPGRGKTGNPLTFSNWKIPVSTKPNYAWMAGKAEWFECHEHNPNVNQIGTKVCLNWFTDGALHCPRCRPHVVPTTVAYVPLYREVDTKPSFVFCHESVADLLAELEYGRYVMVGRVDEDSSIFVKAAGEERRMVTQHEDRKQPCDLMPTLLTVWAYPQLDQWILALRMHGRAAKQVPAEGMPTESTGTVPLDTAAIAEQLEGVADAALERALRARKSAEWARQVKSASKNGKHDG